MTLPKQKLPQVSIYLPTKNRSTFLRRAIESVQRQTLPAFELIVINDGSTDDTRALLSELAATDTRIRPIHLDSSMGAPAARNIAIDLARAFLITGLDDDDEFTPTRLAELIGAFDTKYSLVCSGMIHDYGHWTKTALTSSLKITLFNELTQDQVGTQALIITERLRSVGGFDTSLVAWQDYDLWVRLVRKYGPAKRIPRPLYIQHFDHPNVRITQNGAVGGRMFLNKHRELMTADQVTRHELEIFMLEGKALNIRQLLGLSNPLTYRKALRYFLTSNFPMFRKIMARLRSVLHRLF